MAMKILNALRARDMNKPMKIEDLEKYLTPAELRKYEEIAKPKRNADPATPRNFLEISKENFAEPPVNEEQKIHSPRKCTEFEVTSPKSPRNEKKRYPPTPRRFQEADDIPHSPRKYKEVLTSPRKQEEPTEAQQSPKKYPNAPDSPRKCQGSAQKFEQMETEPASPRKFTELATPRRSSCQTTPRTNGRLFNLQNLQNAGEEMESPRKDRNGVKSPRKGSVIEEQTEEVPKYTMICNFGVTTRRDELEAWIGGLTVLPNSRIAISDMSNKTVKIFDQDGILHKEFWGKGVYRFGSIRGIATNWNGNILLADPDRQLFYEFTVNGEPVRKKESNGCWRVAATKQGNTLAIDYKKRCIFMYNKREVLMRILATANDEGKCVFLTPQSVTVGKDNSIIVVDDSLNAVQIFNNTGDHLKTYAGRKGCGPELLNGPKSACTDEDGNIYVADTGNDMIHMLTPDGDYRATILTREDRIHFPWVIAYHDKRLIIGEQFGKVKIFELKE